MSWTKIGQFEVSQWKKSWYDNSALQPTPLVLSDRIRVYCGFRNSQGTSAIGYVDLNKSNPAEIIGMSETPCLTAGVTGAFDDSGVVPSAVIQDQGKVFLFYAGYQIPRNIRFMVFGGLAVSEDGGKTFTRVSQVPVLDRTEDELLFRVAHSVFKENGKYHVFYGGGSEFITGESKTLPVYDIRYLTSDSLKVFPQKGQTVLACGQGEHRLGRPYVVKHKDHYEMYFGYGSDENPYWLTKAISKDLSHWTRDDVRLVASGPNMNDDVMQAYPAVFEANNTRYLIYNGNEYGKLGFIICRSND